MCRCLVTLQCFKSGTSSAFHLLAILSCTELLPRNTTPSPPVLSVALSNESPTARFSSPGVCAAILGPTKDHECISHHRDHGHAHRYQGQQCQYQLHHSSLISINYTLESRDGVVRPKFCGACARLECTHSPEDPGKHLLAHIP